MKTLTFRRSGAANLAVCIAISLFGWVPPAQSQAQSVPSQIDVMREHHARTVYFDVFDLYTSGEVDEAVEQLAEFEPYVTRPNIEALGLRENWFLDELEALAKGEPEILVPAADLYARLYIHYKQKEAVSTADIISRKVIRLLGAYRRWSKEPEAADIAGRLLVDMSLADTYIRVHPDSFFGGFRQALGFDPKNTLALHILAAKAEKDGLYSEARKWLDRLLAADPDHRPARLRLAVVLAQRGKHRQAVRELETVIAGEDPEWAIIVAYQERIRIHRQRGENAQAMALLREARRRFPDDPQLIYLEAYLLRDRPAASMELLRTLSAKTSWEGPTPRAVYNNWPIEGRGEMRKKRRRELAKRLPLLAEALNPRPTEPVK